MLRKAQCLLLAVGLFLLGGCAIGYESPNGFDVGVRNTQMVTPDSFAYSIDKTGTVATVSWPLVLGAKCFEVSFWNVDDPENPVVIGDYDKKMVDGTSMKVSVAEDCNYKMEIRAIGNSELGNTDDPEPVVHSLTTMVPSVATIPSGSDIYEYLQANPLPEATSKEVAIDLEADGTYTCSGPVDFGGQKMTFRGNKLKWPTVKMTKNGAFYTYSGLKFKFLKFDCAECEAGSLIFMSNAGLPDDIKSQNLGKYYRDGSVIKDIYMVEDPIYIADCWIKDLPKSMIHDNGVQVAFWNFTISNCIIQQKSNGDPFINLQKKGRSIKEIEFKNSTIFNITDKGSYWLRYNNASNATPSKTFGNMTSEYSNASVTVTNCTFSRTFVTGKMANNNRNSSTSTTVSFCVFYDIASVREWLAYGTTKKYSFNFWYAVTNPDTSDPTQKDTSGAPFASTYDPKFLGDVKQSLDLTQPNGGVNFAPGETQIKVNYAGDPRWLY